MGLEFKFDTYDHLRANVPDFLRRQPDFLFEQDEQFHLGPSPDRIYVSVKVTDSHIHICLNVACSEADAVLGLLVRHVLGFNDHVVVSEF